MAGLKEGRGQIKMNKKPSISAVMISMLLLLIGGTSGALALPNPAISRPQQTTRFHVWASTGPLSYLTDAQITVRDAKGKLVAVGKTNYRGIVGFTVRNEKLRNLPLNIVTSGGKVDGMRFSSRLKARAHEVGGKTPIIHLNLISTAATQMAGQRGDYAEALSKVRKALKIKNRAAVDALRVKNPYIDGDRLKHAVLLAGGYTRLVRGLAGLATLGQTMDGLEPPKPPIKTRGKSPAARVLKAALQTDQAPQQLEAVTTSSTSSSPLCTTPNVGDENTVSNYGYIATATLLQVAGVPSAALGGVTGMLLSSVGVNDTSPTSEATSEIQSQLECISTQLNYIEEQLNELSAQVAYDTLQTELNNADNCQSSLESGFQLYNAIANGSDGPINRSNPNICVSSGNGCVGGDIAQWQTQLQSCNTIINNTLFGTTGGEGAVWPQLVQMYQDTFAWYTYDQVQAMQGFLTNWSTMIYYQFVLQNEIYNFSGEWGNAVAFGGGPGTVGSTACAYNPPSANATVCQWNSNIQAAYPPDLYTDEIGLYPPNTTPPTAPTPGTAVNAFPGGLAIGLTEPTPQSMDDSYLSSLFESTENGTIYYDASKVTANALGVFNGQGINPAGNTSAVETYDSPQAMRTSTLTSSEVSKLSIPQTTAGTTASEFFYAAVNQIPNSWPASNPANSGNNIGYYTSDNVSVISGEVSIYPYAAAISVDTNSTILSASPNSKFNCYPCNRTGGTQTILAALLGRTWWPGASEAHALNSTNLPTPPTVPNAPGLTGLKPGTTEIQVAFNLVPDSEAGGTGMTITNYVASCTAAGSTTAISASGMTSPISVGGLLPLTQYSCTIQAQNAGGLSALLPVCPNTSCSTATTTGDTTPSAPVGLTAKPGYAQIGLVFSPPVNSGGQPITGYKANCTSSTAGASPGEITGSGSPLVVTGLTGSASYNCSVAAQNSVGTGPAASVTATALSSNTPEAPILTKITVQVGSDPTALDLTLSYLLPAQTGGSSLSRFDAACLSTNATPSISFGGSTAYGPSADIIKAYGPSGSSAYTFSCTITATNQAGYTSQPSNAMTVAGQ